MRIAKKKEVVSESTINLPLTLKSVLRFSEKVMNKESGILFQLPVELFGLSRKRCVLQEDIIDFCSMQEVKTLTLVAYMA